MFGLWGLGGGILLFLFGIFCVFFFPSSSSHQEESLAIGGVVIGLISLVVGAVLIFL
jgi:uncharacterized membrane protein